MRKLRPIHVLVLALLVGGAATGSASAALAAPSTTADTCPARVTSSTISPATVYDGDRALQTITLDRPAPAGGLFVDLTGYNMDYRESTLYGARVPEGRRSTTVPVRFTGGPGTLVLTGFSVTGVCSTGDVPVNDVTVRPLDPTRLAVAELTLSRQTALSGDALRAVVRLSAPARPTGTTISIISSNGFSYSGGLQDYPLTVTVPAGQTTVSFPLSITAELAAATNDSLSAYTGTSKATDQVLLLPKTLAVTQYLRPDQPVTRLLLSLGRRAPAGGAVVRISTTIPGLRVPATVTVPAGAYYARFPVTHTTTSTDTRGVLTATWAGQTYQGQLFLSYTTGP